MALSAFELCEDTFGMSRDDLESIIAFLRSAESRQMSHSDVEKLVRERSYELSRKLFQAHVDSRGPGEAAAPVRGADGVERDQERIHERGLTTIFGEIRVKRFGYGAEGADSLHPLDAELNLPRERYSFELRRTAAVGGVKGSVRRGGGEPWPPHWGEGWKAPSGGAGGSCGRGLRRLLWAARSTGRRSQRLGAGDHGGRQGRCDATQRPA